MNITKKKINGILPSTILAVCETKDGISIIKAKGGPHYQAFLSLANKYKLNDIEFTVHESAHQYQFKGKVNSFSFQVEDVYLVGYKNKESGEIISVEEYGAKAAELLSKREYDEDNDSSTWFTIEDKRNYEKYIATYEQVRETETRWQDFKLEYYPISYSAYQEIVPLWQIGEPLDNPMCQYSPTPTKWFKEIADELGFQQIGGDANYSETKGFKYRLGKHNDLQFVTMNGTYLYGSSSNDWKFFGVTDTYENCIVRLNSDKKKIRDKIEQQKRLLEETSLNKNERAEILKELQIISSYLRDVSAKEKSRSALDTAQGKVRKLIESL
jgi:hypothetical protein